MSTESPSEEGFVRFLRGKTGAATSRIGDDCVILDDVSPTLLATVDCMVSSVHFSPDATPRQLARKLVGINLSDIAAMGGRPRWALLTVANQRSYEEQKLLADRIIDELQTADVELVGGDFSSTSSPSEEQLSLTVLGQPAGTHLLRRSEARPGDRLMVSGSLGAVQAILSADDPSEEDALYDPPDRLNLARTAVAAGVRCAIDLSDGLIKDLGRICEASSVGATLDYREIPVAETARELASDENEALRWALEGGEDFELLLAVPPDAVDDLSGEASLSEIGEITAGDTISWNPALPASIDAKGSGYDHFEGS